MAVGLFLMGIVLYRQGSDSFRRLRESYFLINLTPTVKPARSITLGWYYSHLVPPNKYIIIY